jgi:hypothetical protein
MAGEVSMKKARTMESLVKAYLEERRCPGFSLDIAGFQRGGRREKGTKPAGIPGNPRQYPRGWAKSNDQSGLNQVVK